MKAVIKAGETPDHAYILRQGSLEFALPSGEKFTISERNIIFGSSEFIHPWEFMPENTRVIEVSSSDDAHIEPVPSNIILQQLKHYTVGFNISRGLAFILREANRILSQSMNSQSSNEKKSQEYAKLVVDVAEQLIQVFNEKRFPVFKTLHEECTNTLTYRYGLGFKRLPSKTIIDINKDELGDLMRTYKPGGVICNQGDPGGELFVLESGELGIYIGDADKPFVRITQKGEVIGEMSLLLRDPRNATMRAETEAVLSVISKDNLQEVAGKTPTFFKEISKTLVKRTENTILLLKDLKENRIDETVPEAPVNDPHKETLVGIRKRIEAELAKKDFPDLRDIFTKLREAQMAIAAK